MIDYDGPTDAWVRALLRARNAGIRVHQLIGGTGDYQVWESTASGHGEYQYTVALRADMHSVYVECDCQAGMHDRPCLHSAQVLLTTEHIPALPEGYDGGMLPTSWGKPQPVGPAVSGREAMALLYGEDD